MPDDQEPGLGYDPEEYDTFKDNYKFDFNRYTEKRAEILVNWDAGSADNEDWSYPGKKWQ